MALLAESTDMLLIIFRSGFAYAQRIQHKVRKINRTA